LTIFNGKSYLGKLMKKILLLSVLLVCITVALTAQTQKPKFDPVGKWKFDAPYAPEGYNNGIMEFVFAEGKYSAFISFTGSDYKIPLEGVKVANDSIRLNLYVEGADIAIKLKMKSDSKISGAALSPDGEIPLTAVKEKQ